jgi:hypothetical protein
MHNAQVLAQLLQVLVHIPPVLVDSLMHMGSTYFTTYTYTDNACKNMITDCTTLQTNPLSHHIGQIAAHLLVNGEFKVRMIAHHSIKGVSQDHGSIRILVYWLDV